MTGPRTEQRQHAVGTGTELALAVDVGGTRIKTGLIAAHGDIVARSTFVSDTGGSLSRQLADIAEHCRSMVEGAGAEIDLLKGIAFGFPGVIDARNARVVSASERKFPDAEMWDPEAWARQSFGLPIVIDNDARMALIGEWHFGAGKRVNNLVAVTIGTGLGAAAVVDGRVLRGQAGRVGILGGHAPVPGGTAPCYCGRVGCAEAEASSTYLSRLARDMPACTETHPDQALDYGDIIAGAERGDACAREILQHSINVWAAFVHNMVVAYDPELLVLGGGVVTHHPEVRDNLVAALSVRLEENVWTAPGLPEVTAANLGDDAALMAAHPLLDEFPKPAKEHTGDRNL